MFKVAVQPFFWAAVTISLVGDLGARIEGNFKAKFKRLSQQEYNDLVDRMNPALLFATPSEGSSAEGGAAPKRLTDAEVVDMVLLDWDELVDEHDQKLPYTPDNRARVETILGARAAIVKAFFEAHTKAPEKNSAPQPAGTTAS